MIIRYRLCLKRCTKPPPNTSWWIAQSKVPADKIQTEIEEGRVSGYVLEYVKQVVPSMGRIEGMNLVKVQVAETKHKTDQWFVELGLTEMGIGLIDLLPAELIPSGAETEGEDDGFEEN